MRVLKLLGVGVVVAIAVFIAVGFVLPSQWHVEREMQVRAPLPLVQARIAHLKSWPQWSATSTRTDPNAAFSWDGADGAPGSAMRWSGPKLGRGTLTLVEVADDKVVFDGAIESERVNARSTFKLSHDAGVTTVRWEDEGATPPIVGGYMRDLLEEALRAHITQSLDALARACEADAQAQALAPVPAEALQATQEQAQALATDAGVQR